MELIEQGPEILIKRKNVVMDSQVLTTLMSCPRLTDFRFNKNLTGPKGNSIECGSIVHAILEHYNKARIDGKSYSDAMTIGFNHGKMYISGCPQCIEFNKNPVDDGDTVSLWATPCSLHKDNDYLGVQDVPEENETKAKHGRDRTGWKFVLQTMAEYFDFYRNDNWTIIAAEETRGQVIYTDDEIRVMWKAKFDEIDDTPIGILSTDHKTMKQNRDTLTLNNQFKGQCVLLKSRNIRINKIGFQTSLKAEDKFKRALISYSADALAEWVNEIVPFYAYLLSSYTENGYWPPNYSHCENKYGFCAFKVVCESDRNMREQILQVNFKKGKEWDI